MISTTTMMMSSPALSWVVWPTSSIVTSSEGVNAQHVYLTVSGLGSAKNVKFCIIKIEKRTLFLIYH